EYLGRNEGVGLVAIRAVSGGGAIPDFVAADIRLGDRVTRLEGSGNGPVSAFIDALATIGIEVSVLDYAEHAMSAGSDARAAAYVECRIGERVRWGVGIDTSALAASLQAVLSAVGRATAVLPVRTGASR
ncbi:alpha-isopropylmalate synthase regulatory domain-containing protein, partial [Acrocarpospora phusangensis]|uniref:alpha-isopropylmalate synthase regulatory domain-containing protein n=1 Tax=Acrocarpospora phusangensis TaxID=1070424 RepID=UPI0023B26A1B